MPQTTTTINNDNITVTLVRIPGDGASSVSLTQNTSLSDVIGTQNLHGRQLFVNGEAISPDNFVNTALHAGDEIFATGTVKGN